MPAKQEPNIGLNYGWAGGESGINLQLDENWRAIGALLQLSVISKTTDVPASPNAGDRYIVPTGATSDWSGHDGKVARYNEGAWEIYTPLKGWLAFVADEDGDGQYHFFDGTTWTTAPIDDAGQVAYNPATSGLTAQDVQTAIDELAAKPGGVTSVDGETGDVDLSGSYEAKRQNNLSATTDPTATDDANAGYEPLSRWINTSTGEIWLCVDATNGAANWQKASLTLDELGSAALADVGTGASQLPRNSDLGSAAQAETGDFDPVGTATAAIDSHETTYDHPSYDAAVLKQKREELLAEATLSLDFANNRYSVFDGIGNGQTLVPYETALTHTRGSEATGWGVGKLGTVGVDTKRLVRNPVAGKSQGLLIEEQRTNLLLWSEDFTQTSWAKVSGLTASSNALVSPDGTMSSDVLTTDGVSPGQVHQDRAIQSDGVYTASVFLEKTSSDQFHVILPIMSGGTQLTFAVHFNSLTGEYLDIGPIFSPSSGASVESVIVEDRGAFWRVAVTVKNNSTGNGNFRFAIQPNRGESLGNAMAPKANTVGIWGAQLELGTFASSYIRTESSQVTRTGEFLSRALGSEVSQRDYSVVFSFIPLGLWPQYSSVVQFRNAAGLVWRLEYNPSISTTGWTLNYPGGLVRIADTNYRKCQTFSVSKSGTKLTVYSEGAELATLDDPAIASSNISSLLLGASGANFVLRDFFFIPRYLSAEELQTLTTPGA